MNEAKIVKYIFQFLALLSLDMFILGSKFSVGVRAWSATATANACNGVAIKNRLWIENFHFVRDSLRCFASQVLVCGDGDLSVSLRY